MLSHISIYKYIKPLIIYKQFIEKFKNKGKDKFLGILQERGNTKNQIFSE